MGFLSSLSRTPDFSPFRRGQTNKRPVEPSSEKLEDPAGRRTDAKKTMSSSAWPSDAASAGGHESPLTTGGAGGSKGGFFQVSRFIPRRQRGSDFANNNNTNNNQEHDYHSDVERQPHGRLFSSPPSYEEEQQQQDDDDEVRSAPPGANFFDGSGDTDGDLVTATEGTRLRRGLAERHLSMLGIAGAIGTGLFLGLGQAVQRGGPLGALLGYATVGMLVCAVQLALGEVAALLPVTGAFVRHAEFLVDPAWGFAVGWNLVYGNLLSIPTEITAICVFFQYWTDAVHPSVYIVVFILLTTAVGFAYVRVFGEVEFFFALLKIALVVFLVVFGLVVDLGGIKGVPARYLTYWADPGPFVEFVATGNWGRFLGYWSAMTGAVFSFAGVESIAMAGAETKNPRKAIPAACKNVFIRIVLFYMLSILIVGMLVASNNPDLDDSGSTVAKSPFVLAVAEAGIPAIPHVINAIVITSAWSASNQALLAGTRVLYGLAIKRQAPRIFLRTTSWGVPYVCVLLFTLFMFLSFMTLSNDALTVFWWLVSLTSAGVLFSWISILLNHIRLRLAMKKQGIPISRLPWYNSWTIYTSWFGLILSIIILLTAGFAVFTKSRWEPMTFVSSYLDIPLVLGAYLIWKFTKGTRLVDLSQVPLHSAFEQAEQKYAALNS